MFKVYFYLILFFLGFSTYSMAATVTVEEDGFHLTPLRFQVGFEFQAITACCDWATDEPSLYKASLLNFSGSADKPLWELSLDINDLEFITKPFSDQEEGLIRECMENLSVVWKRLNDLLIQKEVTTFDEWAGPLEGITYLPLYQEIRTREICLKGSRLCFAPQVTIQHPLQWTIPLYCGLFGGENLSSDLLNISCALPYLNLVNESIRGNNVELYKQINRGHCTKSAGLVFLHALTLASMTPIDDHEGDALKLALKNLRDYDQVNPKMSLCLMSRRPFSSMYKDCAFDSGCYSDYFRECMIDHNKQFTHFREAHKFFNHVNYGMRFFYGSTRQARSLVHLLPRFDVDFVESYREQLIPLLEGGVLTTTMLRHTEEYRELGQKDYLRASLDIVHGPYPRNSLTVDGNSLKLSYEESDFDALSPPWFLSDADSMGKMKDPIPTEEKVFGEAIVEVRAIRDVGPWFLKRARLWGFCQQNRFLTDPETASVEALHLFDFFKGFTLRDIADIYSSVIPNLCTQVFPE